MERLKLISTILTYYRHERIVEDIAEYGQALLLTSGRRRGQARNVQTFYSHV